MLLSSPPVTWPVDVLWGYVESSAQVLHQSLEPFQLVVGRVTVFAAAYDADVNGSVAAVFSFALG
jgi:hypothetical protein